MLDLKFGAFLVHTWLKWTVVVLKWCNVLIINPLIAYFFLQKDALRFCQSLNFSVICFLFEFAMFAFWSINWKKCILKRIILIHQSVNLMDIDFQVGLMTLCKRLVYKHYMSFGANSPTLKNLKWCHFTLFCFK